MMALAICSVNTNRLSIGEILGYEVAAKQIGINKRSLGSSG